MVYDPRGTIVCSSAGAFNFVLVYPFVKELDAEAHEGSLHLVVTYVPKRMSVNVPEVERHVVADVDDGEHRPDHASCDQTPHASVVDPSEVG